MSDVTDPEIALQILIEPDAQLVILAEEGTGGGGGGGEPVPGFYQGIGPPAGSLVAAIGSTYLDTASNLLYRLDGD